MDKPLRRPTIRRVIQGSYYLTDPKGGVHRLSYDDLSGLIDDAARCTTIDDTMRLDVRPGWIPCRPVETEDAE